MDHKTPNVYVTESSVFPPSVAEVSTAIPAFVGYTEFASRNGADLKKVPTRIRSLLEYNAYFGGEARPSKIEVTLNADGGVLDAAITPRWHLYNSLQLYFANGGGPCWIVSVGGYFDSNAPDTEELKKGVDAVAREDEPTLLVVPDATRLDAANKANSTYDLYTHMLGQAKTLGDRFAILDVHPEPGGDPTQASQALRDKLNSSVDELKYGAAYYPFVYANIDYRPSYRPLTLKYTTPGNATPPKLRAVVTDPKLKTVADDLETTTADAQTLEGMSRTFARSLLEEPGATKFGTADELRYYLRISNEAAVALFNLSKSLSNKIVLVRLQAAWKSGGRLYDAVRTLLEYDSGYTIVAPDKKALGVFVKDDQVLGAYLGGVEPKTSVYNDNTEEGKAVEAARGAFAAEFLEIASVYRDVLNIAQSQERDVWDDLGKRDPTVRAIANAVTRAATAVPPSGAIAGVYARTDATRGVWKAPANQPLALVIAPTVALSDDEQENFNVDPSSGKSINAIRAFSGRGVLVWGARTLAGNDNEWRYVSVRRFFNMVEESVKKAEVDPGIRTTA